MRARWWRFLSLRLRRGSFVGSLGGRLRADEMALWVSCVLPLPLPVFNCCFSYFGNLQGLDIPLRRAGTYANAG